MLSDESHSFIAAFKLTPHPSLETFYAHPDDRVPSILALFLLLVYSGRILVSLIATKRNWSKLKAMGWFREREGGYHEEGEEVDDEEKRLRLAGAGAAATASTTVESWRAKTLGAGAAGEEMEDGKVVRVGDPEFRSFLALDPLARRSLFGSRPEMLMLTTFVSAGLIAIFAFVVLWFSFFTISSLVSLRPDAEILCYLLGIVSFLSLAASRYVALFKLSMDLQQAREKDGREGERERRDEVFCVRAFVGVHLVSFSRGLLFSKFPHELILFLLYFLLRS